MFYTSVYESGALGSLTLASDGDSLVGLWLPGQKYFGAGILDDCRPDQGSSIFEEGRAWLDSYFSGQPQPLGTLRLNPIGTEYQKAVWKVLREIPFGEVITYGQLAQRAAALQGKNKGSARAAGAANGKNPLSIIQPCHRVVGSDGSLTGYAGGIQAKLWLLKHEGVDTSRFYLPSKGTAL